MLAKTFDCHKKCDTIREIKLRRGSGLLEQADAHKPDLHVLLKWKIAHSGWVILYVMPLRELSLELLVLQHRRQGVSKRNWC